MKEIKDMTKKELIQELNGIEQHIELFSYGRQELLYREQLFRELGKRKIVIEGTTTYKEVT